MTGRVHGTNSTYCNYGCRCEACRAAHTAAQAMSSVSLAARLAADPSAARHGERSTYINWGCRCLACTAAEAEYKKAAR